MATNNDIAHGIVDFDTDTWIVVEKTNGSLELQRQGVSITYYEKFSKFKNIVKFLRRKESVEYYRY